MEVRRVELRMSWRDVSTAAGMSYEGLRAIRRGERQPNAVTRGRIEDALHWAPGSVEAVLQGGSPRELDTPAPAPAAADPDVQAELTELRDQLASILDRIDRLQRRQ